MWKLASAALVRAKGDVVISRCHARLDLPPVVAADVKAECLCEIVISNSNLEFTFHDIHIIF